MLVELRLESILQLHVILHEPHVGHVRQYQHNTLPPHDGAVQEEDNQQDEVHNVEGHVPKERPPGEVKDLP